MATKTVNVSEETKKFLDAIVDVMEYTQDRVVQMALYKLCPVDGWDKMTREELVLAIAKNQSRRLRFQEELAMLDKHCLDWSDLKYPDEFDGIRDWDTWCARVKQFEEDNK
jgi:hypothetical protein